MKDESTTAVPRDIPTAPVIVDEPKTWEYAAMEFVVRPGSPLIEIRVHRTVPSQKRQEGSAR